MPRMVDLVRKSQLSSNMMQAAARGALMVPPGEMLEILVHLALHNKVFGEQARMTLAGWDENASQKVAADPATNKEVLEYLISPKNIRTALLPALLENSAITEEQLAQLGAAGSRAVVEAMLSSARVKKSAALRDALRSNPRLRPNELDEIDEPKTPEKPTRTEMPEPPVVAEPTRAAEAASNVEPAQPDAVTPTIPDSGADPESAADEAMAQALEQFLEQNKTELATVPDSPFQPIGGIHETAPEATSAEHPSSADIASTAAAGSNLPEAGSAKPAASAAVQHARKPAQQHDERRQTTLWKIAKLDVKGRIALGIRGTREERSILIRDGTKLVALAVLDSPKVTEGEVEGFAQQKNVLEAVLRAIPMNRRFVKNYAITRNLVFNPRTPLDVSLGLMKGLLIHDLKNLSGNKEVPETIRKLALRMFKQKVEMQKKD